MPRVCGWAGVDSLLPMRPAAGWRLAGCPVGLRLQCLAAHISTPLGRVVVLLRSGRPPACRNSGRLPLRQRLELAISATNGLIYLHEMNVVHFDVSLLHLHALGAHEHAC